MIARSACSTGSRVTGVLLMGLLGADCAIAQTVAEPAPHIAGLVRDTRLKEISGIAASRRGADRYWVHDDSGNRGELFAINSRGSVLARLRIDGARKLVDPEDIASFSLDGTAYLLLADTGDNGGVRKNAELIILVEPDFAAGQTELQATPAWRVRFHYADAPHDVEAVAVDSAAGEVLLLTKRTEPLELWSVPLRPSSGGEIPAVRRGELARPLQADAASTLPTLRPTAMDIDAGGQHAYVLTYREVWVYSRTDAETWAQAFARPPSRLPFALVPQAEALSLSRDGRSLYVTGEHWPAPIVQLDVSK